MKIITGIPASSGKAAGKVFRIRRARHKPMETNQSSSLEQELVRFQDACSAVKDRLDAYGQGHEIFAAHAEMLEDITERVISKIKEESMDAIRAVDHTCSEVSELFAAIDDEYLRSRSDDILDICNQITLALTGSHENIFSDMPKGCIIIADNLLPSDTMLIDLSKLEGIALKKGSITSHLTILARSHAIPLVLGIGDELDQIDDGETIVVDADHGTVITSPDEVLLSEATQRLVLPDETDTAPAMTQDNVEIAVYANAGSLGDVEIAIAKGADGIGLLRTEFIFMQGVDFPTEEEQYAIYSACAAACQGKTLTIRTLDIGADKQLPYYTMKQEENPVLGLRGIRFSLASPEIFKTQLRAVLRASVLGNICLMFPMITSMEEYDMACALLDSCKETLRDEGLPFDESLHPGMMIETPASVILSDDFAQKVSFFSIGTNDLTQYMLAVDRENPYANDACTPLHPAVMGSMEKVIESSKKYGIDVSICGELASDPQATERLLKLGIRKLSVTGTTIPMLKKQIRIQTINP